MESDITITPELTIPAREISFSMCKSGGPGGQHVNKVNSKVLLRWDFAGNTEISEEIRQKIASHCRTYVIESGELLITSTRFRSQQQNMEDCVAKLQEMLQKALAPKKKRRKTRVPKAIKEKRLEDKKKRAVKKQQRRNGFDY